MAWHNNLHLLTYLHVTCTIKGAHGVVRFSFFFCYVC